MDQSEIKAWALMTSPGKRFQTRSRRKCGGEKNLPKGRKGWKGEEGNGASPFASGHRFLNFSYGLKLDPVCSFHLTLNEEDGDAVWCLGADSGSTQLWAQAWLCEFGEITPPTWSSFASPVKRSHDVSLTG